MLNLGVSIRPTSVCSAAPSKSKKAEPTGLQALQGTLFKMPERCLAKYIIFQRSGSHYNQGFSDVNHWKSPITKELKISKRKEYK